GDGHAVPVVKRPLAVALASAILDVVVDERRLVEALDRGGDFPELARDLAFRIIRERLVDRDREEGTPSLPGAREPLVADALEIAFRGAEELFEPFPREPRVDLVPEPRKVHAVRSIFAREVDDVPDPILVDRRVLAVVLKERDRDAQIGRAHV